MNKNPFPPYSLKTLQIYFGLMFCVLFLISFILPNYSQVTLTRTALLQLGRVMGGTFAFIFGIGIYIMERADDIRPRFMPLFPDWLLYYVLFFVFSTIFPFMIHSLSLKDIAFKQYSSLCFDFSFFCLAFIPLAYGSVKTRYDPRYVFRFLRNAAIDNIEKTKDYTKSWQHIIDITKICNKIYEDDVDLFSAGIRHLIAILKKGIELYEQRNEIILNGKGIPIEEWIRLIQTRIIWIGEKVVENRLAFERVIVEVIAHLQQMPEVIFSICYYLCKYAREKGQNESLRIGLLYFIPWCKEQGLYEKCKDLESA